MDGIDQLFKQKCYAELGVAMSPSAPSSFPPAALAARTVLVQLVYGGRMLEARVANIGQGAGRGIFAPILPGDELVVLFPGGDPNRAIVIAALGNGKSPNPVDNDALKMLLMHPGGVLLSNADQAPGHGIVHGQYLADHSGWLTAVMTFMTAVAAAGSAATPALQVAAIITAATDFLADPAAAAFQAGVTASASSGVAPGVGGPPYATTLHKVTP